MVLAASERIVSVCEFLVLLLLLVHTNIYLYTIHLKSAKYFYHFIRYSVIQSVVFVLLAESFFFLEQNTSINLKRECVLLIIRLVFIIILWLWLCKQSFIAADASSKKKEHIFCHALNSRCAYTKIIFEI